MEKRACKRFPVSLEAKLTSGYINYAAFVGNLSEYGLYVITVHTENPKDLNPKIRLELQFQLPSGETLKLNCRKKWAYKITQNSLINNIGMEILNPPLEYKEFLSTLS